MWILRYAPFNLSIDWNEMKTQKNDHRMCHLLHNKELFKVNESSMKYRLFVCSYVILIKLVPEGSARRIISPGGYSL